MSYISISGLTVAVAELLVLGAEKIEAHAQSLAKLLHEELKGSGWTSFRSIEGRAASSHIISLEDTTKDIENTLQMIRNSKIVCGGRNGRIRVSIAHFNDENDIRSLAAILS